MVRSSDIRAPRYDPREGESTARTAGTVGTAWGASLCPLRPNLDLAGYPRASSETGHATPVPPIPQYPPGFFARYCW